jgi:hypothetical protein
MGWVVMSFRANNYEQISLNDRLNNLTDRERRFLDKSWAKPFAEKIFPLINETRFEVLYSNDNGRPNTPVNIVVGSLLLKEMTRLTDEELLESVLLDPRYQYALHLTGYEEIPFSDRTVSRFRERLYWHEEETGEDLLKKEIEGMAAEFSKMLKIHGKLKRMDSAMASSSCKRMGRLELMYTCVANLVKALVKSGESDALLPEHLLQYAEKSDKNSVCYRLEGEEVRMRLEEVTAHALEIYKFAENAQGGSDEFQLLERMLGDQTENGVLKPNKKVSPRSLQNPSDEDATFRRKAGKGHQGYVVNFVEDCGEEGNIISKYAVDENLHSDTDFCAEIIEELGEREERTVLITDGAYPSDENFDAAEKNNILLAPTALTGQKPPEIIADFVIEGNDIIACPAGHAPDDCKYNEDKDQYRAHFDKATCDSCPHRDECPVIMQKRTALVKLSPTSVKRARYVRELSTEEYKEYARKRNGVEGIPSVLRRRYGVDRMPIRGLVRSKMWIGFKIGAMNIKRVIAAVVNASSCNLCSDSLVRKYLTKAFFKFSPAFACAA